MSILETYFAALTEESRVSLFFGRSSLANVIRGVNLTKITHDLARTYSLGNVVRGYFISVSRKKTIDSLPFPVPKLGSRGNRTYK